jgi:hypothetical protein
MLELVQDATAPISSADSSLESRSGSVIGSGEGASGRALSMPWRGRWSLLRIPHWRNVCSRCRWLQISVRSSSSPRQVSTQRSMLELVL